MTADGAGPARRRLTADERALWARVMATVTPLDPARAARLKTDSPPDPEPPSAPATAKSPAVPRAGVGPRRTAALPAPPGPAPKTPGESLDSSWDKRLSSGRIVPDLVVDLHGLRREAARQLLYSQVAQAERRGARVILVITGKGSQPGPSPQDLMEGRKVRGAIRADLPRWLGEEGLSGRIAAVRQAHPAHGGAGAAYLILKRRRA